MNLRLLRRVQNGVTFEVQRLAYSRNERGKAVVGYMKLVPSSREPRILQGCRHILGIAPSPATINNTRGAIQPSHDVGDMLILHDHQMTGRCRACGLPAGPPATRSIPSTSGRPMLYILALSMASDREAVAERRRGGGGRVR